MAVQTITYSDKTALNTNPDIDAVNKCQASDLNEIKSVVNNNATELSSIVESGSNAYGSWVKYSDGTMICWNKQQFNSVRCNTLWGSVYSNSGDQRAFDVFPQTFYSAPTVTLAPVKTNGDFWLCSYGATEPTTTQPPGWQISRGTSNASMNITLSYIAIGRWKQ